jgi:peptidoglycan/xylan/chitin deacetylase (PgdA/CDA1 family)
MPQGLHPHSLRVDSKRPSPVVALLAILAILGSLTLAANMAGGASATSPLTRSTIAPGQQRKHLVARQRTRAVIVRPTPVAARLPPPGPSRNLLHVRFLSAGNLQLPEIALTFDDGPNPIYTPRILAILKKYQVKATFFDVGRLVAAHPDLTRREYSAGHIIGNHTWTHANLTLLSAAGIQAQLDNASATIQTTTGVRPLFFRPPYGLYNFQVLAQANYLGITTVMWNVDSRDWTLPGVEKIVAVVLHATRNGAILLFHDGGGDRSQTVAALPAIIIGLRQRGFRLVTLQQMVKGM